MSRNIAARWRASSGMSAASAWRTMTIQFALHGLSEIHSPHDGLGRQQDRGAGHCRAFYGESPEGMNPSIFKLRDPCAAFRFVSEIEIAHGHAFSIHDFVGFDRHHVWLPRHPANLIHDLFVA